MKKYFQYDDEKISGWDFFGRNLIFFLLGFFLIGIYLMSVIAYKRARTLGYSKEACKGWAIWGFIKLPWLLYFAYFVLPSFDGAFNPIFLSNTIPSLYLWFANRQTPEKEIDALEKKIVKLKSIQDTYGTSLESQKLIEKDISNFQKKIEGLKKDN